MRKDDKTRKLLLRLENLRVKIAEQSSPVKDEKTNSSLSESFYQTLRQNFPGGGFQVFDHHLVFLDSGESLTNIGLPLSSAGKTLWEVFPLETCITLEPHFRAVFKGNEHVFDVPFSGHILQVHTLPIWNHHSKIVAGMALYLNATEGKKDHYRLKKKTAQLSSLYALGQKLTSIVSRDELLPWITREAVRLLDADGCSFRIREGDTLVRGNGTKEALELMVKERLKIGESLSGIIARDKKPLIIDKIQGDQRIVPEHRKAAERLGFHSYMGVPMMIGDSVIGVLNVWSKKPGKFRPDDLEPLSSFARCSAIALHNARLFEGLKSEIQKRRHTEENLREKTSRLKTLNELSKKINSMASKEELLHWIAEEAKTLIHADFCNFRIKEGDYLKRGGGTKEGLELLAKEKIKIGENLGGLAAMLKKPVVISENLASDPRYTEEQRRELAAYNFKSYLGVPMTSGENVTGVLNIYTKEKRLFTQDDIELVSSFADMAATALENRRLFKYLEEAKEKLERSGKSLEEKVEISARELQQVHDQLLHAERLATTGKLGASVAHEINNPLQAIDNFIALVIQNLDDNSMEKEYLKLAQEGIDRIIKIVRRLSSFYRADSNEKAPADINQVVKKAIALTKHQLYLKKIRIVEDYSEPLPRVKISSHQIHQVLINLILNAEDAMSEDGELGVITRKEGDSVCIEIKDSGSGIPEDLIGQIFEPFFTTKSKKGSGLGLSVSYEIIKTHGGDITVKSFPGQGTTFTIKLPAVNETASVS